jgi:hypothetical protein
VEALAERIPNPVPAMVVGVIAKTRLKTSSILMIRLIFVFIRPSFLQFLKNIHPN